MRFLGSSKCSKAIVELTFTKQKANALVYWTGCFVFYWKYLFLDKFGPTTRSCQFKLTFGTKTNLNMKN